MRAIAQTLPLTADYRLVQNGPDSLVFYVDADAEQLPDFKAKLNAYLDRIGVDSKAVHWDMHAFLPPLDFSTKLRRITRTREAIR